MKSLNEWIWLWILNQLCPFSMWLYFNKCNILIFHTTTLSYCYALYLFVQDFTFHNCSCLNSTNQTASDGVCDTGCQFFFPVLIIFLLITVDITGIRIPVTITTLRWVNSKDSWMQFQLMGWDTKWITHQI